VSETFAERWARRERECGLGDVAARLLSYGDVVLPDSAAPFLTFREASTSRPIYEVYASPDDWSPEDRTRLVPYAMIGSDGAGSPICVDKRTGHVVLIDHDNWFRTVEFINSSVAALAECLLARLGEVDVARFRSSIRRIDEAAMAEGTFWWHEAQLLEADA
jgi:hypothetical protein